MFVTQVVFIYVIYRHRKAEGCSSNTVTVKLIKWSILHFLNIFLSADFP